jgi:plastocyanin
VIEIERRLLRVGMVLLTMAASAQACGGTAASAAVGPAPAFEIVAENTAYDIDAITVPAGTPFTIMFTNRDPVRFHDIDIREADNLTEVQGQKAIGEGEAVTYEYDALPAGTYTFVCSIHVGPAMIGTLTVE